MEPGEENMAAAAGSSKRPRAPLSDSEDNSLFPAVTHDDQKRRRLESAAGRENRSPTPSGRRAELDVKPDTPAITSVRSRLQLLSETRPGGVPFLVRAESDPGSPSSQSVFLQDNNKGFRQLLGEGEFNQRLERFRAQTFEPSSSSSSSSTAAAAAHDHHHHQRATTCPRSLSNLVSDIHQKIQGDVTPSSKEASRIRQEREQEVRLLVSKPIANNVWLKRSNSDPSLPEQADGDTEMKDGSFSEMFAASTEKTQPESTEGELNSRDEANTADMIDEMFGEVLEYAGQMEAEQKKSGEGEDTEDSAISACSGDNDQADREKEKRGGGDDEDNEETDRGECEEKEEEEELDSSRDELTFPTTGILSPLSKSVEAVVTPLRLAVSQQSNPPSLLLTPEELSTPPADSSPLYSVDAYRTQRQSNLPTFQSVTPGVQRKAQEKSRPQQSINIKDKILALNEEAVKLQTVISQTLQALSCCTDEEHGRGSVTEAEAEKLLLVSCEKRAALLAEVSRLREDRLLECDEAGASSSSSSSPLMPCRGTVAIGNIQLPLKVEFVYSSRNRTGQPSHFFFVLIRYGPCNIVATPLATAADAKNGDTISFPTSVTMKDIRSNFEIDVEVYSLSHTSGNSCTMEGSSTKPRAKTPRKLLNTIMHRSSSTMASSTLPVMHTRRSSNFCLVGSHKITLASLGQSKFPLDKVPFLSPLEGNIYLHLESQSHSNVQHQGFLTMFEMITEFGVWHRRFFALEGSHMYYWNHPNDRESKTPEGSISLSSLSSRCVEPVKRDFCARPFTFELVSNVAEQKLDDDVQKAAAKCWFAADTKEEQLEWMEKLNQVLLDVHTWSRGPSQQTTTTSQKDTAGTTPPVRASRAMRESSL